MRLETVTRRCVDDATSGRPPWRWPAGSRDAASSERVSEYAGTVQAIVSDVDGGAPEAEALEEAFAESAGEYNMQYHPNVSTMVGSW